MDSGAGDNFIDEALAKQSLISIEALPSPRTILDLDGKPLARVMHYTKPLTSFRATTASKSSCFSSPCRQLLGFSLACATQPPAGLGEWLSDGLECSMPLRLPPLSAVVSFPARLLSQLPKPPDLSKVPEQYHNLAEVFGKQHVLSLHLHRPYDCGIDLLPCASLPSILLFSLSRSEWESMEEYIGDSLPSGFPSPSSVRARFFFFFFC